MKAPQVLGGGTEAIPHEANRSLHCTKKWEMIDRDRC